MLFFAVFAKTVKNSSQINKREKEKIMEKYVCTVCQYVYDPAENNNVPFEQLPDDYVCPLCGVGKDMFEKE